jgi:hypothetical protein
MNEDTTTPNLNDDDDDAPIREDAMDQHDEAVIAADDTGMLGGEQLITQMEIERGLRGGD